MKQKVLIVDDKPENIQVLMQVLEESYAIVAATNGEKALELAHKEPMPDIILLDVSMPGMDGFEVCQALKSDPTTEHIPVVFITARDEIANESKGLSLGAVDYITKPIVPFLVKVRVNNHLELKKYRDDLEKRVSEETAKRMEQQEMMLRQSRLAAMGEMMSAITHQWAQPLNSINLNVELADTYLEEKPDEIDKISRCLQNVKKTVEFMSQTMHDFKNYFKPNKSKIHFPIKEEIETVLLMLSSQLKNARITPHNDVDSSIEFYGIPSEFKQVILNLVSNAKDAIKSSTENRGPGDIWFRANQTSNTVTLEVEDSGGGIPQDILSHIFDDYFTTKGEGGTGIGLAMSRMIIEEGMGGELKVTNGNNGAIFTISLSIPRRV